MMKLLFSELLTHYTTNKKLIGQLWTEIESSYSSPKRHYHTLHHLQHILDELSGVKQDISDWDTVLFSVFYHDITYNPLRRDNEERSAAIAENRLSTIDVPAEKIAGCQVQIMATKSHVWTGDKDTDYFTDADLAILGQEWAIYESYKAAIRKEYSLYPDLIYKPGRKAVVEQFLQQEKIFKTDPFFNRYEKQARVNLQKEMEEFSGPISA